MDGQRYLLPWPKGRETGEVELIEGKRLVIKLLEIGRLDEEGYRTLYFEVNDSRRAIKIFDKGSNVKKNR